MHPVPDIGVIYLDGRGSTGTSVPMLILINRSLWNRPEALSPAAVYQHHEAIFTSFATLHGIEAISPLAERYCSR